jgi:hypothetical protein
MTCSRNALAVLLLGPAAMFGTEPAFFAERVAPILEQHCVSCHGAERRENGLQLDSFAALIAGAEYGDVIVPGRLDYSELYRRITLPHADEDSMPADGKPPLSADEVAVIRLWIAAGASETQSVADFPTAPALRHPAAPITPLTPDWRPFAADVERIAREAGVRIVPRSLVPTDGLILRTASSPTRCGDASLGMLGPIAALIVEAELARTNVTDAGLASLAACVNLRSIDLTQTRVTSDGIAHLSPLVYLEKLNLSLTAVDEGVVTALQTLPALRKAWLFGTGAEAGSR